jgi:hypothetical protein
MVRLAVWILADAGLGQFSQANHEVRIGRRVVRPPSLPTVFAAIARVVQPAEIERAVEARAGRKLRRHPLKSALELKVVLRRHTGSQRQGDEAGGDDAACWHESIPGCSYSFFAGGLTPSGALAASGAFESER